jgi:hypothetical protein
MPASLLHLHTYFLFPFSINKEIATKEHIEDWQKHKFWIHGLDECIVAARSSGASPIPQKLGPWRRSAYAQCDANSPGYQDMIFFHPFVRRIFFDTGDETLGQNLREPLIRCYSIPFDGSDKDTVWLYAEDARGRKSKIQVTDLRMFLFANGMGILSIGVEAQNISVKEALWINEAMRKIYPSSARQIREGRGPNRIELSVKRGEQEIVVEEERFENARMVGFQPPLSRILKSLIYFLDYDKNEYEQLLDERMIIYSCATIDPTSVPGDFKDSDAYQILLSRFLYVDQDGPGFRYEREFTRGQMREHLYKRWAHEGTYYGFTSYSNITVSLGVMDRGEHVIKEGNLIHRMFDTRYYLMAIIALFYRASLLDFAQKTALVSRRLFRDQEAGALTRDNIEMAGALRAEFLHFSNYWFFEELANKDEEIEHFVQQCKAYHVGARKMEVEQEVEKLNAYMHEFNQNRSTEAVNRLAMLSMIFGAGAVLTGFFGMNFGSDFGRLFFNPDLSTRWVHFIAVVIVSLMAFGALTFGFYLVVANPTDYKEILTPRGLRTKKKKHRWFVLKRSM